MIGADNNIAIKNPNAIYNLPIPTNEVDFGNIKNRSYEKIIYSSF